MKITPNTHKNQSGLIQLIMMGESIRQIWVKFEVNFVHLILQMLPANVLKPVKQRKKSSSKG